MDAAFWVLSKLFWEVASPDKLLLLFLLTGTSLLWTRRQALGRYLVTGVLGVLVVIAVFPVSRNLIWVLENRFAIPELPPRVDGIIVLAGAETPPLTLERGQPIMGDAAERLTTFVYLSRRYSDARLVFSGGSGALTDQGGKAEVTAKLLFQQLGVDLGRVQFESDSRNTWENGLFSYRLIKPHDGEIWLLIDSAYRMPRSVGIFRKVGWKVIPYPVDFQTSSQVSFQLQPGGLSGIYPFSTVSREIVGIAAYWATGRMSELFPGAE